MAASDKSVTTEKRVNKVLSSGSVTAASQNVSASTMTALGNLSSAQLNALAGLSTGQIAALVALAGGSTSSGLIINGNLQVNGDVHTTGTVYGTGGNITFGDEIHGDFQGTWNGQFLAGSQLNILGNMHVMSTLPTDGNTGASWGSGERDFYNNLRSELRSSNYMA